MPRFNITFDVEGAGSQNYWYAVFCKNSTR